MLTEDLELLKKAEVKFKREVPGRTDAYISCHVCNNPRKVVKQDGRAWSVFNFFKHLRTHSASGSKRPSSGGVPHVAKKGEFKNKQYLDLIAHIKTYYLITARNRALQEQNQQLQPTEQRKHERSRNASEPLVNRKQAQCSQQNDFDDVMDNSDDDFDVSETESTPRHQLREQHPEYNITEQRSGAAPPSFALEIQPDLTGLGNGDSNDLDDQQTHQLREQESEQTANMAEPGCNTSGAASPYGPDDQQAARQFSNQLRAQQSESEFVLDDDCESSSDDEATEQSQSASVSGLARTPLLKTYVDVHERNHNRKKHGERYSEFEKDLATYDFLASGSSYQTFKKDNMCTASKSTIKRHIAKHTRNVEEGRILSQENNVLLEVESSKNK